MKGPRAIQLTILHMNLMKEEDKTQAKTRSSQITGARRKSTKDGQDAQEWKYTQHKH